MHSRPVTCTQQRGSQTLLRTKSYSWSVELRATPSQFAESYSRAGLLHRELLPVCCTKSYSWSVELRATPSQFAESYSRAGLLRRELLPGRSLLHHRGFIVSLGLCGWQRQRQARSHFSRSPQGVHSGSARTLGQAPGCKSCQHCDGAMPGSGPRLEALSLPTQGPALGQFCRSISRFCSTTLSR